MASAVASSGQPPSASNTAPVPTPSPSLTPSSSAAPARASDLRQFETAARGFADRFNANWADAPAAFADFTSDAILVDPTNMDFTIGPGSDLVTSWAAFGSAFPSYRATTQRVYVSSNVAALTTAVAGLGVPLPDGLLHELRVFRFTSGAATRATSMELWYELKDRLADTEGTRRDCVAPDRCPVDARAFADAYIATWASADVARIAAMYSADAVFTDAARGVELSGPAQIARWGEPVLVIGADGTRQRFGGNSPDCRVRDVFIQTDGADPRTSDNTDPKGGTIAGVAIAYACELGTSPGERPVEGLTLLLLGTRQARSFDNDLNGLIVSEEVLHDTATATRAGLVR